MQLTALLERLDYTVLQGTDDIPVTDLVTDTFPLSQINETHEFALAQKGLKVAVTP